MLHGQQSPYHRDARTIRNKSGLVLGVFRDEGAAGPGSQAGFARLEWPQDTGMENAPQPTSRIATATLGRDSEVNFRARCCNSSAEGALDPKLPRRSGCHVPVSTEGRAGAGLVTPESAQYLQGASC